jgi:hypothetical protein
MNMCSDSNDNVEEMEKNNDYLGDFDLEADMDQ